MKFPKSLANVIEAGKRKRRAVLKHFLSKRENKIKKYFLSLNKTSQTKEIKDIVKFFEKNEFNIFPYEYIEKYKNKKIKVFYDSKCSMRYVLYFGKRLYFPVNFNEEKVKEYYLGLLSEQDVCSPHRYENKKFNVNGKEVIADIGAAEGIWALKYAQKAKKIYLFECDEKWIAALKKTFEPYKKKTVIVNKYVSDKSKGNQITIDDFFRGKQIDFIKADIEGQELAMLKGGVKTFAKQKNIKVITCAYHRQNDEILLKGFLEQNGFKAEHSKGYMLFVFDKKIKEPYIRRGLIRAHK